MTFIKCFCRGFLFGVILMSINPDMNNYVFYGACICSGLAWD